MEAPERPGVGEAFAGHYRAVAEFLRLPVCPALQCSAQGLVRASGEGPRVQDKDLRPLAVTLKAVPVVELDLREQEVASAQALAAVLPACPALRVLRLGHNSLGDGAAAAFGAALGPPSALQVLDLSHNCITDKGVTAFATAFKASGLRSSELRELYLHGNVGTGAAAALELTQAPRLRTLGFSAEPADRPGLDMACRLRGIRLVDRGPEERQRLASWMASTERTVQQLHQLLEDRTRALEERCAAAESDAALARRERDALGERVAGLEQQVGKEQRECQRILEMVLDLTRHSRPPSSERSPLGLDLAQASAPGAREAAGEDLAARVTARKPEEDAAAAVETRDAPAPAPASAETRAPPAPASKAETRAEAAAPASADCVEDGGAECASILAAEREWAESLEESVQEEQWTVTVGATTWQTRQVERAA